jgi:hypothetical protein
MDQASTDPVFMTKPSRLRVAVLVALIVCTAIVLSSKGIFDEGTVDIGDMSRHMMNGVFLLDALKDLPRDLSSYAHRYFARYPALSLGHHPIILPLAEVPVFAVAGISVFSARLVIVFFSVIAGVFWFFLVRDLYEDTIAFFSSLLFLTSSMVVKFTRVVMSEVPALAFLIITVYYFRRHIRSGKLRDALGCALGLILCLYAKALLAFLIPLLIFSLLLEKGINRQYARKALIPILLIAALSAPLVMLTAKVARWNLVWVFQHPQQSMDWSWLAIYVNEIWRNQLSIPVLLLSICGIAAALAGREKREIFFLLWILLLYLELLVIGPGEGRYAIYWIPPLCLFALLPLKFIRNRAPKIGFLSVLAGISGLQIYAASKDEPRYAEGYEEAARFIVKNQIHTVLYSSPVDDGYFVFFVRKHDTAKRTIVLRADKLLATSKLNVIVSERISSPSDIYDALQNFGVQYLVIEDVKTPSRALEWLRQETRTDRFIERAAIPLRTNIPSLRGARLLIYEYRDSGPPRPDAIIRMSIPLMGKDIAIPLADISR